MKPIIGATKAQIARALQIYQAQMQARGIEMHRPIRPEEKDEVSAWVQEAEDLFAKYPYLLEGNHPPKKENTQ